MTAFGLEADGTPILQELSDSSKAGAPIFIDVRHRLAGEHSLDYAEHGSFRIKVKSRAEDWVMHTSVSQCFSMLRQKPSRGVVVENLTE